MARAFLNGFFYNQNNIDVASLIDRTITEIEIPEGVTKIGKSAFFYCLMASGTVVVPEGVWCIGQDAFNNCIGITEIKLPESLTTIEGYAFSNMRALKRLVLPSKVTSLTTAIVSNSGIEEFVALGDIVSIGVYVFHLCPKCRKYDFTACTSVPPLGGVTSFQGINAEAKILVPQSLYEEWVVATNWAEYADYIVPDSSLGLSFRAVAGGYEVWDIGECTDTNIVIPSEYEGLPVISIGNYAFQYCKTMRGIEIPDSVTSIGEGAFFDTKLTIITIPESVTDIGIEVFAFCSNLTDIYLPWSEGEVSGAPWGATGVTIHYNSEV